MKLKSIIKISLFLPIVALMLFSCNNTAEDSISEQLSEKKKQLKSLEAEIKALESEMLLDSTAPADGHKRIPVEVLSLEKQAFEHYFSANGMLEAVKEAYISPETSGQINKIYVKEGQQVKKGQVLARLNSSIIQNTIEEIKTQMKLATLIYEKQSELWSKKIGSEVEYLTAKNNKESLESRLKTTQSQLDMTIVKSPVSGVVDKVDQKEGELAMPGMQMMLVVNLDELYINTDVSEKYLPYVNQGDIARVIFPTYPDLVLEIPVHLTGNVIHPQNRTFNVRFSINNHDKKLKPNLLSIVELKDFKSDSALVIPSICIKQDINGSFVYVATSSSETIASKRYVEAGLSQGGNTMITSGLESGEKVIVKGYSLISNGSRIAIKN